MRKILLLAVLVLLTIAAVAVARHLRPEGVDADTPGPDGGPACAADANYLDESPTGLRADAARAWADVVAAASDDGVTVCLNDGKRSRDQQIAIYDDYVELYGTSTAEDLVLPPDKSAHVTGTAIDVQPTKAYRWLQATDGAFGFCRIYDNEPWHFEYDDTYEASGCPARLPKPTS